ncbi:MAG TPA: hypothetical protein VKV20_08150 [Ktedonobacteraceae bacterium]|jgi:hypothetical protein|nr:hypothetical protein [Ktedonobacteraceae bacterium]
MASYTSTHFRELVTVGIDSGNPNTRNFSGLSPLFMSSARIMPNNQDHLKIKKYLHEIPSIASTFAITDWLLINTVLFTCKFFPGHVDISTVPAMGLPGTRPKIQQGSVYLQ